MAKENSTAKERSSAAKKAWATRRKNSRTPQSARIDVQSGTDAHRLVVKLLRAGVCSCVIEEATGQSKKAIAAMKAHETMGTYNK